jgi:3-oxoadipate enol-lactonase
VAEIDAGGFTVSYDVSGRATAPSMLLSHALGTTADLWSPQMAAFTKAFRVIRYDTRGHGRSGVPPGSYTIDQLGRDALAVLDAAGVDRAHICGLSLGGLTAMWLGIHAPHRIVSLILSSTAPRIGTTEGWNDRIQQVRTVGLGAVADATMQRWFTETFRQRHPDIVSRHRAMVASCHPDGYVGCCAAIRDADLREAIRGIDAPALVIAGTSDPVTTPDHGREMRAGIARSRMVTLEAAHLSNVERADEFNATVLDFLEGGLVGD